MARYLQIGTIVATLGLKGEVVLLHKLGQHTALEGLAAFFIEKNKNNFIPYFIHAVREKNQSESYIKLEDIESKEAARPLLKKGVYLEEPLFREKVTPDSHLFYLGFNIHDQKEKNLGEIVELVQMHDHLLAKVYYQGDELLLPLSEQTIKDIDISKKTIFVSLPDGLIDIYRS